MDKRINLVCVIIGDRGTGKTYYTLKSLLPTYKKTHPAQRILVIDMNDHESYRHIQRISTKMLPRWKGGGIYRIFGEDEDVIFESIRMYVTNTLVLFEDGTSFFDNGKTPRDIKRFLIDTKQKNNDIVFQFHGFSDCPPIILGKADVYTIFKCDGPDFRKKQVKRYPVVKQVWQDVMNDKNPYANKTVPLR
jgi:hypothetical protein